MKYIRTYESKKDDIIEGLQKCLLDKPGWNPLPIKFIEGIEKISREFNSCYQGEQSIIPNQKYDLLVANKEEVRGYFIISGKYKVNDDIEKERINYSRPKFMWEDTGQYSFLYTPQQFKRLLKYVSPEVIENWDLLITSMKYNL